MSDELRWKQRFQNLDKAYTHLAEIANYQIADLSNLEKEGFVQRFEYTVELTWKTLKDYLSAQGIELSSPKEVIRQALQNAIISDGDVWIEALNRRNQSSHTYNELILLQTITFVKEEFYPVLQKLYQKLMGEMNL